MSEQGTDARHFMALDGLRGVAALLVVVYHRRFWIDGYTSWHGYLAVDFFFLLSGFVISYAYGSRLASGRLAMSKFLIARVIRLYPLILIGALLGAAALLGESYQKHWLGLAAKTVAAFPFAIAALPQPVFAEPFRINGPVWSLFFEIVANVSFVLAVPRLETRRLILVVGMLGLGLGGAILAHGDLAFGWTWPTLALGLLRVGFPFFAGVILERLHGTGRLLVPALPVWASGLILSAILLTPTLPSRASEIAFTALVAFVAFPLIVASAANDAPRPRWLRVAALSAALSYPLYIVHLPVLQLLDLVPSFVALPVAARYPLAMAVCVVAAALLGRYFDEPLRVRLRQLARTHGRDPAGADPTEPADACPRSASAGSSVAKFGV